MLEESLSSFGDNEKIREKCTCENISLLLFSQKVLGTGFGCGPPKLVTGLLLIFKYHVSHLTSNV